MARVPSEGPEQLFHFAPAAGAEVLRTRRGAEPGEKLLITGIAGGLGRLIAKRLGDYFKVAGVDRSPWEGFPPNVSMHVVDLRKRKFEDVFRTERPDALVHHAFVRHFRSDPRVRHEVNVLGTKRVLEYAIASGVKRVVVLSSSYVYGALADNPFYMNEDYPLNVSRTYPEVRDLAEVDTLATAFLWRHPEVTTTILRPVNTLGYYTNSTIRRYLSARYVPTILGFNPMTQFIHEEDVAEAVALALQSGTHGVFNFVGPGALPPHRAPLQRLRLRRLGLPPRLRTPHHALHRPSLPLLVPGRDARHRPHPPGARPPDQQPRRADRARRGHDLCRLLLRGRATACGPRHGGVLAPDGSLGERAHGAHRLGGRHAQECHRPAPERGGRHRLPRGHPRHEQAHLGALPAAGVRPGLHAPRARDRHAGRAHRGGRLRGAGDRDRQRAAPGAPARHAGLPGDHHLPVARPPRAPPLPRQIPHLLRRADALHGEPERRGRGDRREGGAGEGADRHHAGRRPRGAALALLVSRV